MNGHPPLCICAACATRRETQLRRQIERLEDDRIALRDALHGLLSVAGVEDRSGAWDTARKVMERFP